MNTRENVLAPLKEKVEQVADDLSAFDPASTTLLKEIEAKGENIKNHTDTLIAEFKTKCSQIRASNRQMLEQYQSALLTKISEIEADISALDNCLTGECKEDIVNAAKTGILKTYPCLEYPNGIQDVSFKGSETPVKDVVKLIGKVQIGNECTREEPDDEKIKRLEAQITDLTQEIKRDQTLIQKLQEEMRRSADHEEEYKTRIQTLQRETKATAAQKDTDKARIQTLQANNNGLAGELRDQKRVSEKQREELEQKIQEQLENRIPCSGCGGPKGRCRCTTCPSCSYKGTDFQTVSILVTVYLCCI
ncbi:uncharacterized protein LOC110447494 isoform X1 [Mizuhopecten yessoensis]|uniref:uncharacterized protein LOC110447494 isoform X1 n=1 Tax=Mizuhopecten yessoensis TaxID=6573 RepID=UPI000B457A7A|nr:uncharacterized protein LOC110447494 isoform X1 [Mizuhopecten yessoensis]